MTNFEKEIKEAAQNYRSSVSLAETDFESSMLLLNRLNVATLSSREVNSFLRITLQLAEELQSKLERAAEVLRMEFGDILYENPPTEEDSQHREIVYSIISDTNKFKEYLKCL